MTTTTTTAPPPLVAEIGGSPEQPLVLVRSSGDVTTAELEREARIAWPLPVRLELVSTEEIGEQYLTTFACCAR